MTRIRTFRCKYNRILQSINI